MMRSRVNFRRAFTLIELIMVLALIALMATLVIPIVSNFEKGQRAVDSAEQIVALSHWARTQSVARGVSVRLNVDAGQGQYWLTLQKGASHENVLQDTQSSGLGSTGTTATQTDFDAVGEEFGIKFTLPAGVRLDCSKVPQQPGGQYVEFHPTGRSDPAVIRLVDDSGKSIEIGCLSATEMYHVLSDDEEKLEQNLGTQTPPIASVR